MVVKKFQEATTRTPIGTDIIPFVDDPAGTPLDGKTQFNAIPLNILGTPTADLSMGTNKITNVVDGTASQDAVTKSQLDGKANTSDILDLKWKEPVRVATTANGALATAYENGDTVDGITLATGDRILLKDQTAGAENGIYTVNATGAPTRATDWDGSTEAEGAIVYSREGTANAGKAWKVDTVGTITIGTTAVVISEFGAGGGGVWTAIDKPADESLTSNTTLTADSDLSFSVEAGGYYMFSLVMLCKGSSTGDIKFAFSGPSGVLGGWGISNSTNFFKTFNGTTTQVISLDAGAARGVYVIGMVDNSAGAAGSISLLWAQNASHGTATTVQKGALLTWRKTA